MKINIYEKKTFEEARDDVPWAIGKHHASVKASFLIYMLLPNSANSMELAGFFKREKGLLSLKAEKRLRQKSYPGPRLLDLIIKKNYDRCGDCVPDA